MRLTTRHIIDEAKELFHTYRTFGTRRCRALFGTSAFIMAECWNSLDDSGVIAAPPASRPKHLLWSFYFLKAYPIEDNASTVFSTHRDTFRKHTQKIIAALANLAYSKVSETYLLSLLHLQVIANVSLFLRLNLKIGLLEMLVVLVLCL